MLFSSPPPPPVLRVGSSVLDDTVVIEVQDPGDRCVQERDVVTDHEERPPVPGEEFHQPSLGVRIEVVRRFVQQQQIGPAEQDPSQLEPSPLAAREGPDGEGQPVLGQTQASDDRSRVRLGVIPAASFVFLLEPPEASHVLLRRVLLELEARLLHPPLQVDEPAGGEEILDTARLVVGPMLPWILTEISHVAVASHRAGRGRHLPRQDLEGARLARAVAPDHPHLVAGGKHEVEALDHVHPTGLHRKFFDLEGVHGQAPSLDVVRGVGCADIGTSEVGRKRPGAQRAGCARGGPASSRSEV
jgi:hypothetical protein